MSRVLFSSWDTEWHLLPISCDISLLWAKNKWIPDQENRKMCHTVFFTKKKKKVRIQITQHSLITILFIDPNLCLARVFLCGTNKMSESFATMSSAMHAQTLQTISIYVSSCTLVFMMCMHIWWIPIFIYINRQKFIREQLRNCSTFPWESWTFHLWPNLQKICI